MIEIKIIKPIEKGQRGWKRRAQEILIIDILKDATTPHTGCDMYQKFAKRKLSPPSDDELSLLMQSLYRRGYLKLVGTDVDCGYQFELIVASP